MERGDVLGALEIVELALAFTGEERSDFLQRCCGNDASLRRRVDELLEADARAGGLLEPPVERGGDQLLGDLLPPLLVGRRVGAYTVRRALGAGGMGTVYEAEQEHPRRTVALKMMRLGLGSPEAVRRFQLEGEVLGRLHHPGIAQVYETGTFGEEGEPALPYFAMEYVEGALDLVSYARAHALVLEERLVLFERVCEAVQYGHEKGVIHRDLKPQNLLVAPGGRPVVIDFGLARASDPELRRSSLFTQTGSLLGTLPYMAPEQVGGDPAAVDVRADVYALGAVLFELLCDRPLFDFTGLGLPRAALRIENEEAPRPSRLRPGLPRELDWVVLKALAKDPRRRYGTVGALAADLRRFRALEPLRAGPPSRLYRLSLFVRRHRVGVAAGSLVLATLLAGTGGIYAALLRANRSAALAAEREVELRPLADAGRLRYLEQEGERLWPPGPGLLGAYDDWLERADRVLGRVPQHEAALAELRGRAGTGEWRTSTVAQLVRDLRAFGDPERGLRAGVAARRAFAAGVLERSVTGPEAQAGWEAVRARTADPAGAYGGRPVPPQIGLLPLGPDPASGLLEFAHLQTGEAPARDPRTGALILSEETALVFVLLPGGSTTAGAQRGDPAGARYDPGAQPDETPRPVSLEAFFLSKYELTQAQWQRATGSNPSLHAPDSGPYTGRHPVERVSWLDCAEVLDRLGLQLPTEEQWEYGARGGTDTPWWTGADVASLQGAANVADASAREVHGVKWQYDVVLRDGRAEHAPVGSYRANPHGLHDVHGNVFEWCRGGAAGEPQPYRGGSFRYPARWGRSSNREFLAPSHAYDNLGVRPARAVEWE